MEITIPREQREAATENAMQDPQVGDEFSEMLKFYMYVLEVKGDYVTIAEATAPCEFPGDAKLKRMRKSEYKLKFSYGGQGNKYWITLQARNVDVSGWLKKIISNMSSDEIEGTLTQAMQDKATRIIEGFRGRQIKITIQEVFHG